MSGVFRRPKMPDVVMPPPSPPPISVATPQVQAAADAQRIKARAASGRAATMLTDQDEDQRPTVGTKKLMGQ